MRSPLTDLVSMAKNLSTTKLDKEQQQLLGAILSSGDLVQQLISAIPELPKAQSGLKLNPSCNSLLLKDSLY